VKDFPTKMLEFSQDRPKSLKQLLEKNSWVHYRYHYCRILPRSIKM